MVMPACRISLVTPALLAWPLLNPPWRKFSAISCQTSSAVAASKTRNTRNSFLNQLIKIPFRRVPIADNLRLGTKPLLDARSLCNTHKLWVFHSSILAHLAEKILAIDELKRPSPERCEIDCQRSKAFVLSFGHGPDRVRRARSA